MIDELRPMAIFSEVVKLGSFRAAARALALSPSVVSYQISQLEKKLGTALLYRSTRKLSLTHEGQILFKHVADMLNSAETALEQIIGQSDVLQGSLTITLPSALIHSHITSHLAEFQSRHKQLSLTLRYDDDHQDIIEGGIDLAIRAGTLKDSDLKSRSIGVINRSLVCAPRYLRTQPAPRRLIELAMWHWIGLEPLPNHRQFHHANKASIRLEYQATTTVNSVVAMTQLCIEGLGLATPPEYLVKEPIQKGSLVQLFPEWQVAPIPLSVVWPNNVSLNSNAKSLINHLVDAYRGQR